MTLLTGQKRMRRRFEEILALTASQGPASGAWISDSRSGCVTAGGPGGRPGAHSSCGFSYDLFFTFPKCQSPQLWRLFRRRAFPVLTACEHKPVSVDCVRWMLI